MKEEYNISKQDLFYLVLECKRKYFYLQQCSTSHRPLQDAISEVLLEKCKQDDDKRFYFYDIVFSLITLSHFKMDQRPDRYICFESALLELIT